MRSALESVKEGKEVVSREAEYPGLLRYSRNQSKWLIGMIGLIILYLVYAIYAFQIPKLIDNMRLDRGAILALDSVAHKFHITKRFKDNRLVVSLEGNKRQEITEDYPEWMDISGENFDVDLGEGYVATLSGNTLVLEGPDIEPITVIRHDGGVNILDLELPAWAKYKPVKFEARPRLFGRIQMTKTKIEVHRYFFGWENFFFEFDHPLSEQSLFGIIGLLFANERVSADHTNWRYVWNGFWENKEWQHKDVYRALLETIIMALLGTVVASALALPLAFFAAANFNRNLLSRMIVRRSFDFLRGIDTLIWSLIFIRAFGLGPLTGIMAIAFTMVGELGKLYSEAIENINEGQVEGVRSTGATTGQGYRFGVLPQIMPVFISQTLYYLESNTRSATVIGALGAGGIGLLLVQTIQTSKDWENTLYLIVLTLLVVTAMDMISGWLRRRLL